MVRPFLEFGNIFLLNCNEGDVPRSLKMQKKALRILLRKDKRYSTILLHKGARLAIWRARALMVSMRFMVAAINPNVRRDREPSAAAPNSRVSLLLGKIKDLFDIFRGLLI